MHLRDGRQSSTGRFTITAEPVSKITNHGPNQWTSCGAHHVDSGVVRVVRTDETGHRKYPDDYPTQ